MSSFLQPLSITSLAHTAGHPTAHVPLFQSPSSSLSSALSSFAFRLGQSRLDLILFISLLVLVGWLLFLLTKSVFLRLRGGVEPAFNFRSPSRRALLSALLWTTLAYNLNLPEVVFGQSYRAGVLVRVLRDEVTATMAELAEPKLFLQKSCEKTLTTAYAIGQISRRDFILSLGGCLHPMNAPLPKTEFPADGGVTPITFKPVMQEAGPSSNVRPLDKNTVLPKETLTSFKNERGPAPDAPPPDEPPGDDPCPVPGQYEPGPTPAEALAPEPADGAPDGRAASPIGPAGQIIVLGTDSPCGGRSVPL